MLNTNVVRCSRLRRPVLGGVLEWLERMDGEGRILSVVAIHEIEKGIALLEYKGATAKAAGLNLARRARSAYDDKIIASTSPLALAGQLEAKTISAGHSPGMADAIIAGIQTRTVNDRHPQHQTLSPVRRRCVTA